MLLLSSLTIKCSFLCLFIIDLTFDVLISHICNKSWSMHLSLQKTTITTEYKGTVLSHFTHFYNFIQVQYQPRIDNKYTLECFKSYCGIKILWPTLLLKLLMWLVVCDTKNDIIVTWYIIWLVYGFSHPSSVMSQPCSQSMSSVSF